MTFMILKNFHPFALLITFGIFFMVIININTEAPFSEKIVFLALAGAIYVIVIMFESWRMNQK
jgi:hypothetical protein